MLRRGALAAAAAVAVLGLTPGRRADHAGAAAGPPPAVKGFRGPPRTVSLVAHAAGRVSTAPTHADSLPVVEVDGPAVIAFWSVPESNADLEADPGWAAALDDQQYYWAETRDSLIALGIRPRAQPGRRFAVRGPDGDRRFEAHPDSAVIGYLFVAPGKPLRSLYKRRFPDEILTEARRYFGVGG